MNITQIQELFIAELWLEIVVTSLCLVLNLYFVYLCSKVSVLSGNLRFIVVSTNIIGLVVAISHPMLQNHFLPADFYSVESGHHVRAFFVFGLYFYCRVAANFFGCKYLLITIERRLAFRKRANYESYGCGFAVRLVAGVALIVAIVQGWRCYSVFCSLPAALGMDRRLRDSIIMDRQVFDYIVVGVIIAVSSAVSAVDIYLLKKTMQKQTRSNLSLTESFQITQTQKVLRVIQPLFAMHLVMFAFEGVTFLSANLDYFLVSHSVDSIYYLTANNVSLRCSTLTPQGSYVVGASYLLATTLYMIWGFEPMRRQLKRDLDHIFGIRPNSSRNIVYVLQRVHDDQGKAHFGVLKEMWK